MSDSVMVEHEYSSFLKRYEEETKSKFIIKNIDANFNDKEWQPPTGIQKVYWEWKKDNTPSIPFSGVPFIFVGFKSMMCHQGKDKGAKKKRQYAEARSKEMTQGHIFRKRRCLLQDTKKVGCPAEVHSTRICRFPAFKLDENRERARKAAAVRLREALKRDPIVWENVYIVKTPTASAHVGHRQVSSELKSTVVTDTADLPHRRKTCKNLLRRQCISTLNNIMESVYLLDNEATLLSCKEQLMSLEANVQGMVPVEDGLNMGLPAKRRRVNATPLPRRVHGRSNNRHTNGFGAKAEVRRESAAFKIPSHCLPKKRKPGTSSPRQLPISSAADLHSCPPPQLPTSTAAHIHSCQPPQLPTSTAAHPHSCPHPQLPTPTAAHIHSCPPPQLPTPTAANLHSCPHPQLPISSAADPHS